MLNCLFIFQVIGRNCGEDTLSHWPTASSSMTVDKASFEVLKYLEKIWDSLSSSGHQLSLGVRAALFQLSNKINYAIQSCLDS